MGAQPPLILTERLIATLMQLDPAADIGSELEVVGGRAVELIGEGTEEAISVA